MIISLKEELLCQKCYWRPPNIPWIKFPKLLVLRANHILTKFSKKGLECAQNNTEINLKALILQKLATRYAMRNLQKNLAIEVPLGEYTVATDVIVICHGNYIKKRI